jgi:MFS family permease
MWALALTLSLGAAVSLGITRFAYGLLLPAMRVDLGWSYTLAGAMNTANALGYFLGALLTPWLLKRVGAGTLLWGGAFLASLFMGFSGFFTATEPLLVQRLLAGVASAFVFIAGGLLAARLGAQAPQRGGLLIGLYYGGTGLGIVLSAVLVPWALEQAGGQLHSWRWAWWLLALACVLASAGDGRCCGAHGGHTMRCADTALSLAPVWFRAGWLHAVWHGLYRLHDLCRGPAARTGQQRAGRDRVL